jgi:hypothetical protein
MIALTLAGALSLALAGAADAGGFRMGGGFGRGGRSGFHSGFHGGHFKSRGGFHARVSCMNHTCVTVYSVGAVFPSSGDGAQFRSLEYETPPETPSPAPAPRTQMEIAPAVPREACYRGGCYHLQGDGVTVPYVWAWVPAPPPPPPPPVVLQYFNGRYEQRGDGIATASRWVWIPNAPEAEPPAAQPDDPAPDGPKPTTPVPSQYGQLYRWVDERGTVHWTQGLDAVPERYRPQPARGSAG